MNIDLVLNKASSLAKKRDYESALRMLKDEEDRYYGSFKYYYLYAVICLHSGSFVEAHENFNLARKIKMKDPNTMLGLACLYLKRINTVQAVDYYLDVQEIEPKNKIAKNALLIIKKYSGAEALSDWMTPQRLSKLFPPIPSPAITPKAVLNFFLALSAAAVIAYMVLSFLQIIPGPFKPKTKRPVSEYALSNQERNEAVQTGGYFQTTPLTQDQVINLYNEALSLFADYRDEKAKININKILLSNASQSIKNRAQLMKDSMAAPGFHNFNNRDNISFSDVRSEPAVYSDVFVLWKGMARNVELTNEYTRFDLIVSYDTRTILEGIVTVVMTTPERINTERDMEVLGRITLDNSAIGFALEGIAIHQSGKLE